MLYFILFVINNKIPPRHLKNPSKFTKHKVKHVMHNKALKKKKMN